MGKGDVINYRGRKQMKVNQFRLATAEDGVKTQDFVDGAPLSPNEIQDELSHFILEIEKCTFTTYYTSFIKKISR